MTFKKNSVPGKQKEAQGKSRKTIFEKIWGINACSDAQRLGGGGKFGTEHAKTPWKSSVAGGKDDNTETGGPRVRKPSRAVSGDSPPEPRGAGAAGLNGKQKMFKLTLKHLFLGLPTSQRPGTWGAYAPREPFKRSSDREGNSKGVEGTAAASAGVARAQREKRRQIEPYPASGNSIRKR